MNKLTLAATVAMAAIAQPSARASAREWFTINPDGNICWTMQEFNDNIRDFTGITTHISSPHDFIILFQHYGMAFDIKTNKNRDGNVVVYASTIIDGVKKTTVFYSDLRECQFVVASLIAHGDVPDPELLK
jgi:hypothetical protein